MVDKQLSKPTKMHPLNGGSSSTIPPILNLSTTTSNSLANISIKPSSIVNSTAQMTTHEAIDMQSHMLFVFSTILLLVAVAIIAKIIISSRNGRGRDSALDRWRLSISRSSSQTGRLGLGGGPAMGIYLNREGNRNGNLSLGCNTATYTAMPTSSTSAAISVEAPPLDGPLQEARLDWERQFFDDDDDEEHLAGNMEEELRTESKLQLNFKR